MAGRASYEAKEQPDIHFVSLQEGVASSKQMFTPHSVDPDEKLRFEKKFTVSIYQSEKASER